MLNSNKTWNISKCYSIPYAVCWWDNIWVVKNIVPLTEAQLSLLSLTKTFYRCTLKLPLLIMQMKKCLTLVNLVYESESAVWWAFLWACSGPRGIPWRPFYGEFIPLLVSGVSTGQPFTFTCRVAFSLPTPQLQDLLLLQHLYTQG